MLHSTFRMVSTDEAVIVRSKEDVVALMKEALAGSRTRPELVPPPDPPRAYPCLAVVRLETDETDGYERLRSTYVYAGDLQGVVDIYTALTKS